LQTNSPSQKFPKRRGSNPSVGEPSFFIFVFSTFIANRHQPYRPGVLITSVFLVPATDGSDQYRKLDLVPVYFGGVFHQNWSTVDTRRLNILLVTITLGLPANQIHLQGQTRIHFHRIQFDGINLVSAIH
jgi:hypothetical protein